MEIQLVDPPRGQADGNARNFDMTSYQWSGRPDPDGNTFQFFKTQQGSGLNWAGNSNPKVDEILDKTREMSDQAERKKLYSELVKILQEDRRWSSSSTRSSRRRSARRSRATTRSRTG